MKSCNRCLGEPPVPGSGLPIHPQHWTPPGHHPMLPVERCEECGGCRCAGCVDRNKRRLGLPAPPLHPGGVVTPREDRPMRYHRVFVSVPVVVGPEAFGSARYAADWLVETITETLGIHSTAGLVTGERVEAADETKPTAISGARIEVSALVAVGHGPDSHGTTPAEAADWLRYVLDDADYECFGEFRVESMSEAPETGCVVCCEPPCNVRDVVDGVCADCRFEAQDRAEEEERRQRRVAALLANWAPKEEESASATAYGDMYLRGGPTLRGLIRGTIADGKHRLTATDRGDVRDLVLDEPLADVLVDFVDDERFCGHGTDKAFYSCVECARQVKHFLDGLYKRPVN